MDSEIIDISEVNFDNSFGGGSTLKSTNFGGGLELLMNDKKRESKQSSSDINIDDLNNLENELNELVEEPSSSFSFDTKSDLFGGKPNVKFDDGHSLQFDDNHSNHSNLGTSSDNNSSGDSKT